MIKKYDQFVKSINEEFVGRDILAGEGEPSRAPERPAREVETAPGRPGVSPGQRPSRPSVVPGKSPSVEPAPLAYAGGEEEEEANEYVGAVKMRELANKLDVPYSERGIEYNGKKINFFSETEKFHVDRKKFDDVDSVVDYLNSDNDIKRPEYKLEGEDRVDPEFEAKSYRFTRRDRLK